MQRQRHGIAELFPSLLLIIQDNPDRRTSGIANFSNKTEKHVTGLAKTNLIKDMKRTRKKAQSQR